MRICDAHNDFLTEIKQTNQKLFYLNNQLIKNRKIKYVCAQVWTFKLKNPIKYIFRLHSYIFKVKGSFNRLINKKVLFCIEGLDFITKSNACEMIDIIKDIKPFSCGIVWNFDNNLGGGALGKSGLTLLGKQVVKELERHKILIDTAHMNRKTFYDFCKITTMPIYNSHSNINSLKRHPRNLTNNQIETIINSKGFIGLSFVKDFISDKTFDLRNISLQIKYFIANFGEDNVGIGSDYFGTKSLPQNLLNYNDFSNLKKDLKNIGLSNSQIRKVFYKNFVRFKYRLENR